MERLETRDIYRGAALMCCGARLCDAWSDGHGISFTYEAEGLLALDERYRMALSQVEPMTYRETLDMLRDMARGCRFPHGVEVRHAGGPVRDR